MLLTHNERHFHTLSQDYQRRGASHGGIVIVPGRPPCERLELRVAMLLDWIATLPDHQGGFFKWGQLQARLEQGYRLTGYSAAEIETALAR